MRHATSAAAAPVTAASTTASTRRGLSTSTTVGAAKSAVPSTIMRARPRRARTSSDGCHSSRIDGWSAAPASRKYDTGQSASSAPPST